MDNSPFRKLSAELRKTIWEQVVTDPNYINIDSDEAEQPEITKVCKEIRSETLLMFYKRNTFVAVLENFDDYRDDDAEQEVHGLIRFAKIRPAYTAAVGVLVIHMTYYTDKPYAASYHFFKRNADKWTDLARELNRAGYKGRNLDMTIHVEDALGHNRSAALQNLRDVQQAFEDVGLDAKV